MGLTAAVAGVTAEEVIRAASDPGALFVRPTPPCAVGMHTGPPGVRIVAAAAAAGGAAARRLEEGVVAWLACGAFWRRRTGHGAWMQASAEVAGSEVRLGLVDLAGRRGKPSPWPWDHTASLAGLEQVLLAIHADVPLSEVSYALPA